MHRMTRSALSAFLSGAVLATGLHAQKHDGRSEDHRTTYAIEAFGAGVDFGHFLKVETSAPSLGVPAAEAKLQAERTVAFGGALTVQPWARAAVRAGVTFAPGHFEFRDDSGLDIDAEDQEEIGELDLWTFELSVLYNALESSGTVVPYAIGGVSAGLWRTGAITDEGALIDLADTGDSQIRFGGVGGAGLLFNASETLAFRLEFATFAIGNPFDGTDAFVLNGPPLRKIDEPSITRISRLTAGLVVRFGGGEHRTRRRGR